MKLSEVFNWIKLALYCKLKSIEIHKLWFWLLIFSETLLVHEVMPSSFAAETSLSHAQEDEPHFCAKANWLILRCLIIRNYRPFNLILKHQFLFQDDTQTLYNFQASVICFFLLNFDILAHSLTIIHSRWRVTFEKKYVVFMHEFRILWQKIWFEISSFHPSCYYCTLPCSFLIFLLNHFHVVYFVILKPWNISSTF